MIQRYKTVGRLPPLSFAAWAAVAMVLLTAGGAMAEPVPEPSHPPVKLSDVRAGRLLIRDGQLERAQALLEQARPSGEKEQIERLRLLGEVEMRLGMPECQRRRDYVPVLEWAPEVGQFQAADLTGLRGCSSSKRLGLR